MEYSREPMRKGSKVGTVAVVMAGSMLLACAKRSGGPTGGRVGQAFDPYTATTYVKAEFVVDPHPPLDLNRNARSIVNRATVTFLHDPTLGDFVALQVRHECSYEFDGQRVECLKFACSPKSQPVVAHGLLNGTPARMPPFQCKGYGKNAIDYSAAISRWAVRQIALANQFWFRLPTGEFGVTGTDINRLKEFVTRVDGTAPTGAPQLDLTR